ncbi:MAG: hypothetical protein V4819_12155 [Verrucomicrobiota bacterium]
MYELRLKPAPHWKDYGITVEWIEEKSEWMRRDSGSPGAIDGFFDCAGRLMRLCAYDYYLLGPMFFHAVIGLEAMLRVHYKATDKKKFNKLLDKAVKEGLFHDGIFSEIRSIHEGFSPKAEKKRKREELKSGVGTLVWLLPRLRNQYMHGIYQFHPDFLHLAVQVREMVDTLTMPRTPEWKARDL